MSIDRTKLESIQRLAGELIAALPADPPPPDDGVRVMTAERLRSELSKGTRRITVAPGVYRVNLLLTTEHTHLIGEEGAVLLPSDPFEPPLMVLASNITIEGFEIGLERSDRETVVVGQHHETDASRQPDNVHFIGTKLVATLHDGGKRGFSLHARKVTLTNCTVLNYWRKGQDSQAVWINNGPGPYLINGGTFEASGENILLGGDGLAFGGNPSATIRNATLRKPQEWRDKGYQIKNLFEVKAGVGVTLESCVLDGCWAAAQAGSPIVLTAVDQTRVSPWTRVSHITIKDCIVKNCPDGFGVNILGEDGDAHTGPMNAINLENILFVDSPGGVQVGNAPELSLIVRNTSFIGVRTRFLSFYGPRIAHLDFQRNVVRAGAYGIVSDDGVTGGLPALSASVYSITFESNVIEQSARYPLNFPAGTNRVVTNLDQLLDPSGRMRDGSAGWGGGNA